MSYRTNRSNGGIFKPEGRVSHAMDLDSARATRKKTEKMLTREAALKMDYGDAKDIDEIKKMVHKYTQFGSEEKGYRPRTLDNVESSEIKKIPSSFLIQVYFGNEKKYPLKPKLLDVEDELVRRGVFKEKRTQDEMVSQYWDTLDHNQKDDLLTKTQRHFGGTYVPYPRSDYNSLGEEMKIKIKRFLRSEDKLPLDI